MWELKAILISFVLFLYTYSIYFVIFLCDKKPIVSYALLRVKGDVIYLCFLCTCLQALHWINIFGKLLQKNTL